MQMRAAMSLRVMKFRETLKEKWRSKKGCPAEPVEACGQRPLRATLRQAQGDRPFLNGHTLVTNMPRVGTKQ